MPMCSEATSKKRSSCCNRPQNAEARPEGRAVLYEYGWIICNCQLNGHLFFQSTALSERIQSHERSPRKFGKRTAYTGGIEPLLFLSWRLLRLPSFIKPLRMDNSAWETREPDMNKANRALPIASNLVIRNELVDVRQLILQDFEQKPVVGFSTGRGANVCSKALQVRGCLRTANHFIERRRTERAIHANRFAKIFPNVIQKNSKLL